MSEMTQLPSRVMRPLYTAALGVVVFLGFVTAWSVYAPLATSLHMPGQIVSSRPSFDLQHNYGGQIAEVFVEKHDAVQAGALLLRLDATLEQKSLTTYQAMTNRIARENQVIETLLAGGVVEGDQPLSHFVLEWDKARQQHALKTQSMQNLGEQATALADKIDKLSAQLDKMRDRARRQDILLENGLITRSADEALDEQIFLVSAEIQSERAELLSLEDQRAQAERQAALVLVAFRAELLATRDRNARQLDEMALKIEELQDVIAKSGIRSPISGVITDMQFVSQGMFAPRGQTLLTIAQPLDQPHVAFRIPTHLIDQLRPGQQGQFTIPALPQRNLPKLRLQVTAISPRAIAEGEDQPAAYHGRATLDAGTLDTLIGVMGSDFTLFEDMPVDVLIEGRQTTLAQYLVDPFVDSFRRALQD